MTHVLVVEDDVLIKVLIEEALLEAGFAVTSAVTADQAIEILEAELPPDVVVTDVDMPGSMDGLRLASYVKNRWPPVRLIVASGKRRPSASEMPSEAVFIPKPFLPGEIVRAIASRQ